MNEKTDLIREWYRFDNAATLYSLVTSANNTCIFKLEAVLKHPVNINKLQCALDNIVERFPYYRANMLTGVFWHYRNINLLKPRIITDSEYPCEEMPIMKRGIFPYRVRAYKKLIAVEFHHSITDGGCHGRFPVRTKLKINKFLINIPEKIRQAPLPGFLAHHPLFPYDT